VNGMKKEGHEGIKPGDTRIPAQPGQTHPSCRPARPSGDPTPHPERKGEFKEDLAVVDDDHSAADFSEPVERPLAMSLSFEPATKGRTLSWQTPMEMARGPGESLDEGDAHPGSVCPGHGDLLDHPVGVRHNESVLDGKRKPFRVW